MNAQMQAITKIFPVFFGGSSASGSTRAPTLYFVVSNIWRIGQQHLVIDKLYDEAIAGRRHQAGAGTRHAKDSRRRCPATARQPDRGRPAKRREGDRQGPGAKGSNGDAPTATVTRA